MADNTKPWADKVAQLMEEAFEEALKQVKLRPELLPKVIPLSSCSPKQVKLQMRLFEAARLDEPEAIAKVQSIATEHAGMIKVTEAVDSAIDVLPGINAALLRARKAAKAATPEALAAKAAKEAAKADALAAKAARKVKPEELEAIVQQALDFCKLPAAVSPDRAEDVKSFVNFTLQARGMDKVGRPRLLDALRALRDNQK